VQLCDRRFADLDPLTLYALLRLREGVFVVEQQCAYAELDGRDTEPGTRHRWVTEGGEPLAYLRVLDEPDGTARIGRVCTAFAARNRGLAGRLLAATLDTLANRPVVLDAQSYLSGWYARFGFVPDGTEFIEDGIPHLPMRRPTVGR
jgi:ElaA protein